MKRLMMLFVLVGSVMSILLLLMNKEDDFHILYQKRSYSMMKSSGGESFHLQVLASKDDTFYLDPDYISSMTLKNKNTDEQVALEIKDIKISPEEVFVDGSYYQVSFELVLVLQALNYELTYQEASLELVYLNEEVLTIDLGEFYYIDAQNNPSINLLEMIATHEVYHGLTVSGLYLEIGHNLPNEVIVKDIVLGSGVASINSFHTKEMDQSINYDDKLSTILYPTVYNHVKVQEGSLDYTIRRSHSKAFYFPLTYHSEDLVLHRFYLKILYDYEGELREEVIDDFPFIRQNSLSKNKEDYDVYYPRMHSEELSEDLQES